MVRLDSFTSFFVYTFLTFCIKSGKIIVIKGEDYD